MSKSKRQKRLSVKPPRRLRMKRAGRLQSARATNWVANYQGADIVRGYRKWFGVDVLCAISELRLLGVAVEHDYETKVRRTVENLAAFRQREKLRRASADPGECIMDCDDTFAFIAGYTPGGMPFGVTWEEMEAAEQPLQRIPLHGPGEAPHA